MQCFSRLLLVQAAAILLLIPLVAQEKSLPRTWVDKDTGHRVYRLTDEPGSSALYFNFDAYTPDGRQMVYTSPAGIHLLELATRHTRLLVPAGGKSRRIVAVGRVTGAVYFSEMSADGLSTIYSANSTTGAVRKLLTLPPRATVVTINADETLASGTYVEGDHAVQEYGNNRPAAPATKGGRIGNPSGSLVQPDGKGQMMARRLAAHLPMVLFVVNLQTGKLKELLHSTDWINHMLFSPVDPNLLMYCHEGPWQLVDPYLDHSRRRYPEHPDSQTHDVHGDHGARVLEQRWQVYLV